MIFFPDLGELGGDGVELGGDGHAARDDGTEDREDETFTGGECLAWVGGEVLDQFGVQVKGIPGL